MIHRESVSSYPQKKGPVVNPTPTQNTIRCLQELRKLDAEVIQLHGPSAIPSKALFRERVLDVDQRVMRIGRALDELRVRRNQNKSALEDCRNQIMKLRDSRESDALLTGREKELELTERSLEKELERLQAELSRVSAPESESIQEQGHDPKAIEKIHQINSRREDVIASLPRGVASLYKRLHGAKGGLVLVDIQGNQCGGCHMILPMQFLNEFPRESRIVQCPSCHRVLLPTSASTEELVK